MGESADEAFDHLLDGILDGAPIDWASAESTPGEVDRDLLDELKVLAAVAELHRSAAAPTDPVIARGRWGHLRVLELIGKGAHGTVYRAWDAKLDREVALKLLPARAGDGAAPSNAVIEEGRVLARVRHPNVVTLYGADLLDGYVGLWMERVAGRTLQELVDEGKQFSVAEIAEIGLELCRAVAAVHAAGLVHRDIKASNVMIGADERAVLMDFGTGREVEDAKESLAGTPLYLAPELFHGADPSPRSDLYSIGVLLFHLLTGSYPVVATDLDGLRRAHVTGERTRVRAARADTPARLASVLDRALDPDPERRHPSAEALGSQLGAIARPRLGRFARALAVGMTLALVLVAVWEIRNASTGRPSPTHSLITSWSGGSIAAARGVEPPSIAVLRFDDLGDSSGSDHFAFGLASEILHELARVDGLSVRSPNSSFSFREQPPDLNAIRERLDVNYAVTGSVRRTEDRMRVSAQLVDLDADRAVWADRFDRPLASSIDVFEITDEIARAIVNELRLTLGAGQRRYDLNVETYDLYLQARAQSQFRATFQEPPFELYRRIIELDPTFAPAYAGLADLYFYWSLPSSAGFAAPRRAGDGPPLETVMSAMRQAAERALELDPLLADAHAAMGAVHARELAWEASERSFRRALELDPTATNTYVQFSVSTLRPLGKVDEAERLLRIAMARDPLSRELQFELGTLEFCTGRFEDAIARLAPLGGEGFAPIFVGRALTFADRMPDALAHFEALGNPKQGFPAWYSLALVRAGRREEAEELARIHHHSPHRALFIAAALGDLDGAFEALEQEVELEPQRVPLILTYPELAVLQGDPRLTEIRRRFRLPT